MTNRYNGFTLITFCVYLALFFLISSLSALMINRAYMLYQIRGTLNACIEDAYVAQDVFMHDVRHAPIDTNLWLCKEKNAVSWKYDDGRIEWLFDQNNLVRVYTKDKKRQHNIAVRGVIDGEFIIQMRENRMHMIDMRMKVKSVKGEAQLMTSYGFYGIQK